MEDDLCPITKSIFKYPTLLGDGKYYEYEAIVEWLKDNSTSPLTREEVSRNITVDIDYMFQIREKIKNSEMKEEQYVYENKSKELHVLGYIYTELIKRKKYDKLFELSIEKNLGQLKMKRVSKILSEIPNDVIIKIVNIIEKISDSLIEAICHHGSRELLVYIVENKININKFINNRITILSLCIYYKRSIKTLRSLLIRGANVNIGTILPIHHAVISCSIETVKFLVENNANLNIPATFSKAYPIHYAAERNRNIDILKYIVSQKVDINSTDKYGNSALGKAIFTGDKEKIEFLLKQPNIKLNTINSSGNSYLHLLCHSPMTSNLHLIILQLVDMIDIHIKNEDNKTAFELLASNLWKYDSNDRDDIVIAFINNECEMTSATSRKIMKHCSYNLIKTLFRDNALILNDYNCKKLRKNIMLNDYQILKLKYKMARKIRKRKRKSEENESNKRQKIENEPLEQFDLSSLNIEPFELNFSSQN